LQETVCSKQVAAGFEVIAVPAGVASVIPSGKSSPTTVCVAVALLKTFLNFTAATPTLFVDSTIGATETTTQFAVEPVCVQALLLAAFPPVAKARSAPAATTAASASAQKLRPTRFF
jgi:hypothetical protein